MIATHEAFAPIEANGKTYWLSRHAAARALDMGVPVQLMPRIIESGTCHDAPSRSKYPGCYAFKAGKVALMVKPTTDGPVITTVLWATVDAWRAAEKKAGREYRGDQATRYMLTSWFGADAA